ncbi:hypothetical protein CB1_000884031 [Camelus ferus]|nr:hypothetical protein CB1_000884031 [Camelus ferus]
MVLPKVLQIETNPESFGLYFVLGVCFGLLLTLCLLLSAEPDGPLSVNVFTSAEELERAQRLEERERILREIWRTGQPDLLGTGTLGPSPTGTGTLGRMHYY